MATGAAGGGVNDGHPLAVSTTLVDGSDELAIADANNILQCVGPNPSARTWKQLADYTCRRNMKLDEYYHQKRQFVINDAVSVLKQLSTATMNYNKLNGLYQKTPDESDAINCVHFSVNCSTALMAEFVMLKNLLDDMDRVLERQPIMQRLTFPRVTPLTSFCYEKIIDEATSKPIIQVFCKWFKNTYQDLPDNGFDTTEIRTSEDHVKTGEMIFRQLSLTPHSRIYEMIRGSPFPFGTLTAKVDPKIIIKDFERMWSKEVGTNLAAILTSLEIDIYKLTGQCIANCLLEQPWFNSAVYSSILQDITGSLVERLDKSGRRQGETGVYWIKYSDRDRYAETHRFQERPTGDLPREMSIGGYRQELERRLIEDRNLVFTETDRASTSSFLSITNAGDLGFLKLHVVALRSLGTYGMIRMAIGNHTHDLFLHRPESNEVVVRRVMEQYKLEFKDKNEDGKADPERKQFFKNLADSVMLKVGGAHATSIQHSIQDSYESFIMREFCNMVTILVKSKSMYNLRPQFAFPKALIFPVEAILLSYRLCKEKVGHINVMYGRMNESLTISSTDVKKVEELPLYDEPATTGKLQELIKGIAEMRRDSCLSRWCPVVIYGHTSDAMYLSAIFRIELFRANNPDLQEAENLMNPDQDESINEDFNEFLPVFPDRPDSPQLPEPEFEPEISSDKLDRFGYEEFASDITKPVSSDESFTKVLESDDMPPQVACGNIASPEVHRSGKGHGKSSKLPTGQKGKQGKQQTSGDRPAQMATKQSTSQPSKQCPPPKSQHDKQRDYLIQKYMPRFREREEMDSCCIVGEERFVKAYLRADSKKTGMKFAAVDEKTTFTVEETQMFRELNALGIVFLCPPLFAAAVVNGGVVDTLHLCCGQEYIAESVKYDITTACRKIIADEALTWYLDLDGLLYEPVLYDFVPYLHCLGPIRANAVVAAAREARARSLREIHPLFERFLNQEQMHIISQQTFSSHLIQDQFKITHSERATMTEGFIFLTESGIQRGDKDYSVLEVEVSDVIKSILLNWTDKSKPFRSIRLAPGKLFVDTICGLVANKVDRKEGDIFPLASESITVSSLTVGLRQADGFIQKHLISPANEKQMRFLFGEEKYYRLMLHLYQKFGNFCLSKLMVEYFQAWINLGAIRSDMVFKEERIYQTLILADPVVFVNCASEVMVRTRHFNMHNMWTIDLAEKGSMNAPNLEHFETHSIGGCKFATINFERDREKADKANAKDDQMCNEFAYQAWIKSEVMSKNKVKATHAQLNVKTGYYNTKTSYGGPVRVLAEVNDQAKDWYSYVDTDPSSKWQIHIYEHANLFPCHFQSKAHTRGLHLLEEFDYAELKAEWKVCYNVNYEDHAGDRKRKGHMLTKMKANVSKMLSEFASKSKDVKEVTGAIEKMDLTSPSKTYIATFAQKGNGPPLTAVFGPKKSASSSIGATDLSQSAQQREEQPSTSRAASYETSKRKADDTIENEAKRTPSDVSLGSTDDQLGLKWFEVDPEQPVKEDVSKSKIPTLDRKIKKAKSRVSSATSGSSASTKKSSGTLDQPKNPYLAGALALFAKKPDSKAPIQAKFKRDTGSLKDLIRASLSKKQKTSSGDIGGPCSSPAASPPLQLSMDLPEAESAGTQTSAALVDCNEKTTSDKSP